MKAIVHKGPAGFDGVFLFDMEQQEPKAGEVRIKLKTAGINHRDIFVLSRHKEGQPAVVIGSDGAGIVEAVGEDVDQVQVGQEVVINPSLGWQKQTPAPPEGFEILGFPDHGTFAEEVVVPAENVEPKPGHLSWEEAGILPLGSLTAYRALMTRGGIEQGQTVFIPGVGSGVATSLVQFAKAKGARVIVTSRSEEKRQRALELGADVAVDSSGDWDHLLKDETIDLAIDSVGAATFKRSLGQLKKGGTMVIFGASAGDQIDLDLRSFFYGQYNLLGSTMGSGDEFREMLQFIEKHDIKPIVDKVYPLEEVKDALARIEDAKQFGKIALKISE